MSQEMIGHYRIVAELGRGGMGVVYKAHEESLNRFVAIKVLGEHLSQDPDYVTRFVREAQSAAKLSHPNIVQIYFIGEDDGKHYFVMEYVSGKSLQQLLKSDGRIAPARATRLVLQAASGLAAAHDQGVIHRDIKPANLILSDGNVLKIADFGLALMPDSASRLTVSGMFMGTPGYLSPEQCLDRTVDCRTDIYSLGVTYFEMLTGTMPFRADSPLALIKKIAEVEPPAVDELNPDVDERIRAILTRMMAKDREERYADAHDLVEALEDYLEATGGRRETEAGTARVAVPLPVPPVEAQALNTSPTVAVESGAGTAPVAGAASGPAAGPPPPPPVPPGEDAPEAGGTPWPDEAPGEDVAPVAAAPPPRSGGSRVLLVVLILAILGIGLLGIGGVVAWRTGLLGRGVQMARAAFGGGRAAPAEVATDSLSAQQQGVGQDVAGEPAAGEASADETAVAGRELGGAATAASAEPAATPADEASASSGEQERPPVEGPDQGERRSGMAAGAGAATAPRAGTGHMQPPGPSRAEPAQQAEFRPAARRAAPTPVPPPPPSGTALVVTGEPLLAGEVRGFLEKRLGGGGVELLDDGGLGGQAALVPGEVIARLRGQAEAVVLAQVEYLGDRQVRYMGRSSTVYQARITVQAYRLADGSPVGPRFSDRIEYTQLNVGDKVEKALVGEAAGLASALR